MTSNSAFPCYALYLSVALCIVFKSGLFVNLLSSLLSIVSDDDISVGVRPLRALLVGERIVQFEI